jgi:hypothetical protein
MSAVPASAEAEAISGFVSNPALNGRLRHRARFYFRDNFRNQVYVGSRTEVTPELNTAIKLGFYRAKMYRFLGEQGHDPKAWFAETRTSNGFHKKDRSHDVKLLNAAYPEYQTYTLGAELSQDEVLFASMEEVYDLLCGVGSDYHQANRTRAGGGIKQEFVCGNLNTDVSVSEGTGVVETVENAAFTLDPNTVFGPTCLKVAAHMVKQFGAVPTVYWLWKKTLVPETTDLLRLFGGIDNLDVRNSALRKDMDRKLALMDKELEMFKSDPEARDAYEAF